MRVTVSQSPLDRPGLEDLQTRPRGRRPRRRPWTWFVGRLRAWFRRTRTSLGVYAFSTVFHALLLLVLALIAIQVQPDEEIFHTTITTISSDESFVIHESEQIAEQLTDERQLDPQILMRSVQPATAPFEVDVNDFEPALTTIGSESPETSTARLQQNLAGRSQSARAQLLSRFGGTAESEAAVAAGLDWLARHQNSDGSWSFDHTHDECGESCTSPGTLRNGQMGATAMALLSFLGAGHTPDEGAYRTHVSKALRYVIDHTQVTRTSADLRGSAGGNAGMYIQGLAAIALCEVNILTRNPEIKRISQFAVNFIVDAQDPRGGGWRYRPREAGDTSVVGWQVMALTSARMGRLRFPSRSRQRVTRFLNEVQYDGGAYYGYRSPAKRPSTTAVGLLCRMYLGWKNDEPALKRGIEYLSEEGPSDNDIYYNYYATQVLHHWGGPLWSKWNEVMREQLIRTQDKTGHARGSWYPVDPHAAQGGRLYQTCLSTMTLEVYYRHLPLYNEIEAPVDEDR